MTSIGCTSRGARIVAAVVLLCAFQARATWARGPSTPQERAKVVALVRSLEQAPFAADAGANRRWLREWIIDVPDISFRSCPELLGHALGDAYPYADEVNLQVLFSGAAFTVEQPAEARDASAVYRAGVDGALRAYEVVLESRPDARTAFMDDLLAKRERGELAPLVSALAAQKCKRSAASYRNAIAPLIGAVVGLLLALVVARWSRGRWIRRIAGPRIAILARRVVIVCVSWFVVVGVALHVLEPEFDPRFRFMSEYVFGAYGWLMTGNFFVLAVATFAAAASLRDADPRSRSARVGIGLLEVGAVFICLAGVFSDFVPHLAASAVAVPSVVMGALCLSWSLRHRGLGVVSVAMAGALLSSVADVGMPGLLQRATLLLLVTWLLVVADRMVRVSGRSIG
jgi:hypothetical membrane protein